MIECALCIKRFNWRSVPVDVIPKFRHYPSVVATGIEIDPTRDDKSNIQGKK